VASRIACPPSTQAGWREGGHRPETGVTSVGMVNEGAFDVDEESIVNPLVGSLTPDISGHSWS
jgi:hypothetical protein